MTDGQYATSLRRLDEELRHRGTPESPRLTEVYQTLRDYNVLFYTAHYTSRGALYLYRQNLQRLNENHRGMLRLLSVEEICEEHTLNDLAFLVGVELMITHFQRTIRVLRCYLQHQLQSISELCYLIYVQLPSLREDYAQLSDVIYWAVSQNYDYALYASTPALFDFYASCVSRTPSFAPTTCTAPCVCWPVPTDLLSVTPAAAVAPNAS